MRQQVSRTEQGLRGLPRFPLLRQPCVSTSRKSVSARHTTWQKSESHFEDCLPFILRSPVIDLEGCCSSRCIDIRTRMAMHNLLSFSPAMCVIRFGCEQVPWATLAAPGAAECRSADTVAGFKDFDVETRQTESSFHFQIV